MNLPFNTKAEYLAWRTQWKANYAALSETIRQHKTDRKDKDSAIRSMAQGQHHVCRRRATQMLEERKASKEQAQRLYLAAKAAETSASTVQI